MFLYKSLPRGGAEGVSVGSNILPVAWGYFPDNLIKKLIKNRNPVYICGPFWFPADLSDKALPKADRSDLG
jgi:hypothetical protein